MGLLDALFDQNGGGGGLLDFLRGPQGASFADRFNAAPQQTLLPNQSSPLDNAQWPSGPMGAPATFADRFNAAPQPFMPSGRDFGATFAAADNPPNQAQPIGIGGYQMPRMGSADLYAPQQTGQAALPPNAQPTQGQLPQAPQQSMPQPQTLPTFMGGQQDTGIGDRLNAGFQNFTNAGGPLQALAGGISGLMSGNRTDPQGMQQQNQRAQFDAIRQALIDSGETPRAASSKALAAALNPEAAKTILPELFTSKEKYGVISENPIEGKKYGFVNERDQTINGRPIGSEGSGQTSTGLLASGVTSYNPNLSGNEYLAQFSPEVQAAVKSYIAGDVMPSGNPRQQGIAAQAKTIAQKYGADLGIPVSDALYGEKRKYRTELGSNSANAAGGQAKAFNQGIFHLTELADKLEKLDNSNGLGIPIIAQGANAVRQGWSNEQSAVSDEAKSIGQTVAGEVGKLFSGSAGGGVHEREMTRERFDTIKSKPQLAAALRATLVTMDGGLKALEQNRDRILGPNSGVDFVGEQTKQNIAKIQGAIDRLEGKSTAQTQSPDRSVIETEMRKRGLLK